jgi:transposase
MLNVAGRRVFLCRSPVDMRKSFDALAEVVRLELRMDPFLGDVFLFIGRDRQRLKVLVWEGDGFWVAHRRLESTRLAPPTLWGPAGAALPLTPMEVLVLLQATLPRLRLGKSCKE